jgi:uncharacterized membrane protein
MKETDQSLIVRHRMPFVVLDISFTQLRSSRIGKIHPRLLKISLIWSTAHFTMDSLFIESSLILPFNAVIPKVTKLYAEEMLQRMSPMSGNIC